MGAVYRAWDPELQREVAIKAMEFPPAAGGDDGEAERERFLREARTAARLTHPNIAGVYDVLREGDTAYIVMELIRGTSLDAKLRKAGGPLEPALTVRILREASEALDLAHRNGVVHRDIKPANILIDESGRTKLVDFGIARLIDAATVSANLTAPGATLGTLGYMPPEQVQGDPVDGRADQFSLGVVAYQMTTGKKPFDADTWIAVSHKILNYEPDPATKLNPSVKPEASAAIAKALAKKPEDRFCTCSEFTRAFAGEVKMPGVAGRRRPAVAVVAVIALLVGVGTAGALWVHCCSGPPPDQPPAKAAVAPPVATASKAGVEPTTPPPPAPPPVDPTKLTIGGALIEFVSIPAGQFRMGGYIQSDQQPARRVRITRPFFLGKFEVTRKQWHAVMGGASPKADEADLPKNNVTYDDALAFCAKLTARKDGFRYRLPTEAEWEYAARGGLKDDLYGELEDIAWYRSRGDEEGPIKVGSKDPNPWGLYDMIGNVHEWIADWYDENYYREAPDADPPGPATGQYRGLRGGSYGHAAMTLYTAYRSAAEPAHKQPEYGFRIVRQ
jgi:formylglycine-generating enzyme required for sulfatase activity